MEEAMAETPASADLIQLTAQIVSARLSNNAMPVADVAGLIREVHGTLASLGMAAAAPLSAEKPTPAVPVKKSITPAYLVCLEDGKKLKMLRRHLKTSFNLSPEQYREKWGLPADYPMVAPDYAAKRSELAKKIGLGTKPRSAPPAKPGKRGKAA
jgi:predicted transcriptional regulator